MTNLQLANNANPLIKSEGDKEKPKESKISASIDKNTTKVSIKEQSKFETKKDVGKFVD